MIDIGFNYSTVLSLQWQLHDSPGRTSSYVSLVDWFCIIVSVCDDRYRVLLQYSCSSTKAAPAHYDVISSYMPLVDRFCKIISICDDSYRVKLQYSSSFTVAAPALVNQSIYVIGRLILYDYFSL